MAYASPMKIANGLVLDFTVDNADTSADTFLGLNASGEVTQFASVPRARVSGGGNITEATSSVLSITGGTAAVLTSGLTIQVLQAGAAQSGYLSTTDWNTFNNKLGTSLTSAYIYVGNGSNVATGVAVSGDITLTNTGNAQIVAGAIVNADINASAAIAVSKLEALTASRVLGSNGSGVIQALDTTTYPSLTELAYVKGVTIAIQTQLNNRLSVTLSSPTNGDVITYNGAAWVNSPSSTGVPTGGTTAQILRKIDNTNYNTEWHTLVTADLTDVSSTAAELNKLSGVTTTATQFNFLNTLSADVQAQLAAKVGTSLTQNYMFVGDASNVVTTLASGTNGYVLTSVSGVPTWVSPGVGGTVTSVAASGGTTGMSFTGSPITTSGTLTLTGTLAIANGGTGLTTLGTAGQLIKVNAGATAIEYFTPTYISTVGTGVANELTYWSGTSTLGSLATATYPSLTELSYVKGVTSAIQTQLGTKWSLASGGTLTGNNSLLGANFDLSLGTSGSRLDNFNVYADNAINVETLDTLITIKSFDTGINADNASIDLLGGSYITLLMGNPVSNNSSLQLSPTTAYITGTDGIDTSSISVTKDNIQLLPNSGAPTVGYIWTATNVDGSGGWAVNSGGGWPLGGTGTLTGSVVIEGDGSGSQNVTIGGTLTEIGTFNVRTVGNISLTESVGGAYISITTSGGINLESTDVLRLGSGSGPFIDLDNNTGQFAHSGTGSNPGLTFNKGSFVNTSNQLTLGQTRTVTITAPTPATTDRVWTIPDLSGDMTFVGLTGSQTLTNKTLGTGTVFSVIPTINDGITFTFNPNATVSGLNVGAHTADPSVPVNGDIYYDSTNNLLRARINSAWVSLGAGGGGGIGGSTGATDNAVLRADGTGGSTLQNSALFIDDSGNVTLGTSAIAGGKTFTLVSNDANAGLTVTGKGAAFHTFSTNTGNTILQVQNDPLTNLFQMSVTGSAATLLGGFGNSVTFDVAGVQGQAAATKGSTIKLRSGGGYGTGNTDAGDIYIYSGTPNGSGLYGNIGLSTSSVSDFQDMQGGVVLSNRIAAPTAGITDSVALFAEDSNSSSEFYVTAETGAKVNISGLFEPVTESGTSFTLNETHRNKIVICSNSGVVTVTVGSGKAAGWNCMLVATHATGTITLSTSGTTLNGTTSTTTQFETLSLVHYGSEAYLSKLG